MTWWKEDTKRLIWVGWKEREEITESRKSHVEGWTREESVRHNESHLCTWFSQPSASSNVFHHGWADHILQNIREIDSTALLRALPLSFMTPKVGKFFLWFNWPFTSSFLWTQQWGGKRSNPVEQISYSYHRMTLLEGIFETIQFYLLLRIRKQKSQASLWLDWEFLLPPTLSFQSSGC